MFLHYTQLFHPTRRQLLASVVSAAQEELLALSGSSQSQQHQWDPSILENMVPATDTFELGWDGDSAEAMEEVLEAAAAGGVGHHAADALPPSSRQPPSRPPLARPVDDSEALAALRSQFGAVFSAFIEELDQALGAGQRVSLSFYHLIIPPYHAFQTALNSPPSSILTIWLSLSLGPFGSLRCRVPQMAAVVVCPPPRILPGWQPEGADERRDRCKCFRESSRTRRSSHNILLN